MGQVPANVHVAFALDLVEHARLRWRRARLTLPVVLGEARGWYRHQHQSDAAPIGFAEALRTRTPFAVPTAHTRARAPAGAPPQALHFAAWVKDVGEPLVSHSVLLSRVGCGGSPQKARAKSRRPPCFPPWPRGVHRIDASGPCTLGALL